MSTNSLTPEGITIQDLASILDELKNGTTDFPGLYTIYGTDINLDPNTPDGQLLNLIAQAKIDMLELIVQVYDSFDPDQAVGTALDLRCAINGVKRAGGTFTQQPIEVTVDRAVTLTGLDTSPTSPFVIQDTAGNQYSLITTAAIVAAGTHTLLFQAAESGPVTSAINTITDVVTVTLGVISVNNPDPATSTGISQESDSALRIRRARSVSIPSKGYLDGLIGSLLSLDGVTQVEVFENITNATDLRGIPGHSIWVIVAGGTSADIANVIYIKRSLGCGMKGSTSVPITQADGIVLDILFDRALPENLYIKFNVAAMSGIIDLDYLRQQLLARLSYNINEMADASQVVQIAKDIYPNASISEEGVSVDAVNYYSLVATPTVQHQFIIAQIEINGTVS
jgi:hypothetical protein